MLYLAYGSNLSASQMKFRCPGAEPVGRVDLPDHQLVFRGSRSGCYLSVDAVPGKTVPCIAWRLAPGNEESLDWYEGFPDFYRKRYAALPIKDLHSQEPVGREVCMWYALPMSAPKGAPSLTYLHTCLEGYRDFGLPERALKSALQCSLPPRAAAAYVRIIRG